MKISVVVGALALVVAADGALAACTGTQVKNGTLTTLLSGKTACAIKGADKWQEEHRANGELWDYKKGPNDKVDPTSQEGAWAVTGNGSGTTVKYSYTGGSSYSYKVYDTTVAGQYDFCIGAVLDVTVNLKTGPGCGF